MNASLLVLVALVIPLLAVLAVLAMGSGVVAMARSRRVRVGVFAGLAGAYAVLALSGEGRPWLWLLGTAIWVFVAVREALRPCGGEPAGPESP